MTGTCVTGTLCWHPGLGEPGDRGRVTAVTVLPAGYVLGRTSLLFLARETRSTFVFHKRPKIRENLRFCLWCNSGPATLLLRSRLGACNTFFLL